MNNPLISIIIPTFNRAHLIGKALDSVIEQTYDNWECIIVDDGSTDLTVDFVKEYLKKDRRFQYCLRPGHKIKGANTCRNYGAEISTGEYLIFLDSDDYLQNFCLWQRIEKVSFLENFSFAVFPMALLTSNREIAEKKIPIKKSYLDEFLSDKLHWGIMCALWNRKVFFELDGFNELYPRLNDPDLYIRAMLYFPNDYHIFNEAPCDSVYDISENSISNLFALKVFHSLELFIPDIVFHLKKASNERKKILLKGYLRMWINSCMVNASFFQNQKVLNLFYRNGIVTFYKKNLILITVFFYFSISRFLKFYRKKIIQKVV